MRSKIGFVLFLLGGAGIDGPQVILSIVLILISLFILWKESKKIDVQPASRNVY